MSQSVSEATTPASEFRPDTNSRHMEHSIHTVREDGTRVFQAHGAPATYRHFVREAAAVDGVTWAQSFAMGKYDAILKVDDDTHVRAVQELIENHEASIGSVEFEDDSVKYWVGL